MLTVEQIDFEKLIGNRTDIDIEKLFEYFDKFETIESALCHYAFNIIKGRWLEAESYIKKDSKWAHCYALDVIKGRWPEAEPYIKKDPEWAYYYACDIIKERWPEAEPYIIRNPRWWHLYKGFIKCSR